MTDEGGWCRLGSLGVGNYDDPDGKQVMLLVKAVQGSDVLAAPTGWQQIYSDEGSHADMYGACRRATPPEGYVTLGDIFSEGDLGRWVIPDPSQEPYKSYWCVRQDYAFASSCGGLIWNDDNSHASRRLGRQCSARTVGPALWPDGLAPLRTCIRRGQPRPPQRINRRAGRPSLASAGPLG